MATTSTSNIERARELMRRSRREHFAVGAFNVDNQETLLAIVRAARAKEAPVLVEVSHDEVSMIGLANIRSMVDNYRAEYGVEVYVNLDHSPSVEAAKAGIDAGFEFTHIVAGNVSLARLSNSANPYLASANTRVVSCLESTCVPGLIVRNAQPAMDNVAITAATRPNEPGKRIGQHK
jgi:hypothetical protein